MQSPAVLTELVEFSCGYGARRYCVERRECRLDIGPLESAPCRLAFSRCEVLGPSTTGLNADAASAIPCAGGVWCLSPSGGGNPFFIGTPWEFCIAGQSRLLGCH
jgi:hypothetical protein